MSERMNKERAREVLTKIKERVEQEQEKLINNIARKSVYEHEIKRELQALDIAIDSLDQENLDISIDWLDEFISWAKHRVKTAYENYSDRIDIKINKNELSRIIKILEHYYKKVEPYERKE